MDEGIRIQKVLAQAGVGSRRVCDELVAKGRVKVNGQVAILGQRVNDGDKIQIGKKFIPTKQDLEYYLLNKPKGYVCSVKDNHNSKNVIQLISSKTRLFPVGRLDKDSQGLLIITNDGDLTFALTHPSKSVWKKYLVVVDKEINNDFLIRMRDGINLEDGKTAKAKVKQLGKDSFYISIHEGKNRQIRRMCEALKYNVQMLKRVSIGNLNDDSLKEGQYRKLTQNEILSLYNISKKS